MANIVHRRGEPAREQFGFDPFRMMREMLRFDPFAELERGPTAAGAFVPAFDVKETKDAFRFTADMPGIRQEDLDVSLTGNQLVVSGKREEEERDEGDRYYAWERSYGSFSRAFTLPPGADPEHVNADLKEGVLTVVVGKRPEMQARKIALQPGKTGGKGDGGAKA